MRFGLTVLAVLALMVVGKDAEAQARGSLQATATVVDTRQGFEALSIVQQQFTAAKADRAHTVATVAQISTVPAEKAVVVTVDYSRN